jgi:nitroreductase
MSTTLLPLTSDALLSTTRAVRRRLDLRRPVERSLIEECLELALQAPSASNMQPWSFVVVSDRDQRVLIAEQYRRGFAAYVASSHAHLP